MRWHVFSFAAAIALSPFYTSAATQDITILNRTGYPIQSIYVTELGGTDWGDDVMGRDTLRDGERVKITFDRRRRRAVGT